MNRTLAALLVGGAAVLLLEIRFEHREVLGETALAWTPIVYSGATVLIGAICLGIWDRGGHKVLAALFAIGVLVGLAGLWFHTDGHVVQGLTRVVGIWKFPPGSNGGIKHDPPPALAPLSFCGLGAIGFLVCRKR
jgi:hypothetical protein